jgi:hypothetical protein
MGQCPLIAEGKTKKQAGKELSRKLNDALEMGMHKDGETIYQAKDGKIVAMCCVHS